ncbi:MAG: thioredoxin family protein [Candidatus Babeliaceae bacterium]|nr:thioredoxin family protein [Candidatus Babeliaceae bacterium]
MLIITKDTLPQIQASTKAVIIDAYASWCGPCMYMKPIFEELSKELADRYLFAELNVDDAREIAIQYGVSSVPTFIFIKDGAIKAKETGAMSKEDFIDKIKEIFG